MIEMAKVVGRLGRLGRMGRGVDDLVEFAVVADVAFLDGDYLAHVHTVYHVGGLLSFYGLGNKILIGKVKTKDHDLVLP